MDYRFFVAFIALILLPSIVLAAPLAEATGNITTGEQQTGDVNITASASTSTSSTTTTTPPPPPPVSSGSSGGGATIVTTEETKIITLIPAGGSATISITKSDTLKIDLIEIETKNEVKNAQVTVKESAKPAEASIVIQSDQGKVYKYLEIKTTINQSDISKVRIRFKVEKSWLSNNSIDANTIALNKLVGTAWSKLVTKKVSEDANYIFYEAEMSSLSIFAVTGELVTGVTTTTIAGATTTTLPGATTVPRVTTTTLPGVAPTDNAAAILTILVVAGILIILALILRRRYSETKK